MSNCCGFGEPIYDEDYSNCNLDEHGNPTAAPEQVVVAMYCQKHGDYCNGQCMGCE